MLEIHDLQKSFGDLHVLRGINLNIQKGDVVATWADNSLLQRLTGYRPETGIHEGMQRFVDWYRDFYQV